MCSFSISEPITTDKTTYVNCQSKSPKNHRQNFLSHLSVLITVKPPILFIENFGAVVFWFRSPQNHRYFLWEILARWFLGFANRKTTDTFYGKFWLGGFLVSLIAKPPILFGRKFGIGFFLGTFQTAVLRFQALQKHFYFNVICCNNRNRVTAICKMSNK